MEKRKDISIFQILSHFFPEYHVNLFPPKLTCSSANEIIPYLKSVEVSDCNSTYTGGMGFYCTAWFPPNLMLAAIV